MAEEAVKRRKVVQQKNFHLVKDKEEVEKRLSHMQREFIILQRNAHALDGLATLVEAARRL